MTNPIERILPHLVQPPGYKGPFIRLQAEGAIPNGHRIYKRNSGRDDHTPDGTPGTVLGSFDAGDAPGVPGISYFVAWDPDPKLPILLPSRKVTEDNPTARDEPPAPAGPRC